MVKIIIASILIIIVGCTTGNSDPRQKLLFYESICKGNDSSSSYKYFIDINHFPNGLRRNEWKNIDLAWFSQHNDDVHVAVSGTDTLLKLISCDNNKDYLVFNKKIFDLQLLLQDSNFANFKTINVNLAPPPKLYYYSNDYIIEWSLPNGWKMSDQNFYIVYPEGD